MLLATVQPFSYVFNTRNRYKYKGMNYTVSPQRIFSRWVSVAGKWHFRTTSVIKKKKKRKKNRAWFEPLILVIFKLLARVSDGLRNANNLFHSEK